MKALPGSKWIPIWGFFTKHIDKVDTEIWYDHFNHDVVLFFYHLFSTLFLLVGAMIIFW